MLQIKLATSYCPFGVRTIFQPYIASYFTDPELLLLTMLASEDEVEGAHAGDIITGSERGKILKSPPRTLSFPYLSTSFSSFPYEIELRSEI